MSLKSITNPKKRLTVILILTAVHSFFVGIGLIVQIPILMDWFGFGRIIQPFFPAQGGIFHILMSAAYMLAALRPDKNEDLIKFIIIVKITATLFLLIYFLCIDHIWMVLLSCFSDGVLALLIVLTFNSYKNTNHHNE
ncbi:MAG: hypothetical protein JW956_04860 [Calditrichaceae bacterium]|nr:hypothetical protein [Calditrichaceae bacterium]HES59087.1 hypothetical protein [Caldithrix sp.]